ncbi:MAG: hypothetical protein F8N37_04785 [Telmatospirillum sp.]|nr:hypothetical protein [Telmatospirillum sp.]
MKKRKTRIDDENSAASAFLRGFLATGLLCAFAGPDRATARSVLRQAVTGGAALSVATVAARAIRHRDYGAALVGVAAGAAGIRMAERLLADPPAERT